MSFILDALKKSEAERQRQAGPALLEMRIVRPQRRFPSWLLVVGGMLIVINLLVVLWLFLRPAGPVAPTAAATVATAAPVAPTVRDNGLPARAVAPAVTPAEAPYLVAGTNAAADQDVNPADLAPAVAGGSASTARTGSVPNYSELSGELPPIRLDLHVYAAAPADRYAFINMHKVKEGDTTSEGIRVLEITRDGVVLSYRNTEFLLGRE
jgi:general secretion pathway protein B